MFRSRIEHAGLCVNRRLCAAGVQEIPGRARLDLPVCIHLGRALPNSPEVLQGTLGSVSAAFTALVNGRVPERFPDLRIGFIEFGSMWVPDTLHQMHRRGR